MNTKIHLDAHNAIVASVQRDYRKNGPFGMRGRFSGLRFVQRILTRFRGRIVPRIVEG
jgi:hypothetical protein